MKSFSELTGKEKLIELLRWLCVPAAAVLVVIGVRVIARVVMPPLLAQPPGSPRMLPSDFQRFILPRVIGILMAAGFVIAGAMMAPRYRRAAALALAISWILLSLQSHVLMHLGRGTAHYMHFVVEAVAAAGGAAYIFYEARRHRASSQANDK